MKHKRFLGYGAIGLTLIAIGVAFIRPIGSSNMLFRVLASAQVTGGTITFNIMTTRNIPSIFTVPHNSFSLWQNWESFRRSSHLPAKC